MLPAAPPPNPFAQAQNTINGFQNRYNGFINNLQNDKNVKMNDLLVVKDKLEVLGGYVPGGALGNYPKYEHKFSAYINPASVLDNATGRQILINDNAGETTTLINNYNNAPDPVTKDIELTRLLNHRRARLDALGQINNFPMPSEEVIQNIQSLAYPTPHQIWHILTNGTPNAKLVYNMIKTIHKIIKFVGISIHSLEQCHNILGNLNIANVYNLINNLLANNLPGVIVNQNILDNIFLLSLCDSQLLNAALALHPEFNDYLPVVNLVKANNLFADYHTNLTNYENITNEYRRCIDIIADDLANIQNEVAFVNQLQPHFAASGNAVVPYNDTENFIEDANLKDFIVNNGNVLEPKMETPHFRHLYGADTIFTVSATARIDAQTPTMAMPNNIRKSIERLMDAIMSFNNRPPPPAVRPQFQHILGAGRALENSLVDVRFMDGLNNAMTVQNRRNEPILTKLQRVLDKVDANTVAVADQPALISLLSQIENALPNVGNWQIRRGVYRLDDNRRALRFPGPPFRSVQLSAGTQHQRRIPHGARRCSSNFTNFAQRLNYYLSKPRQNLPNPSANPPTNQNIDEALALIDNCLDGRVWDIVRQVIPDFGHLETVRFVERIGNFISSYYIYDPNNNQGGMHLTYTYTFPPARQYRMQIRLFNPVTVFGNNRTVFQIKHQSNVAPFQEEETRPIAGGKRRGRKTRKQRKLRKSRKTRARK